MAALQVRNFEYVCCERNYFENGFAFCAASRYGAPLVTDRYKE